MVKKGNGIVKHNGKPHYIKSLGYVVDQTTKKRFYYDSTCTVPSEPGKLNEDGVIVYDSLPVLAPMRHRKSDILYLHPSRISKEDQIKLANLYREELRELMN